MNRRVAAFTLLEVLVVLAILGILAGFVIPAALRAREEAKRAKCQANLRQIGQAMIGYLGDNDGFWAFQEQVTADPITVGGFVLPQNENNTGYPNLHAGSNHNPQVSLAVLYPEYVDDLSTFGCPDSTHRPRLRELVTGSLQRTRHLSFGHEEAFVAYPGRRVGSTLVPDGYAPTACAWPGISSPGECTSYAYDDMGHPRAMKADSVRAGDFKQQHHGVPVTATAHGPDGYNVLYHDGRAKWVTDNYCGDDEYDNVFKAEARNAWLSLDTDAVLARTHGDGLNPDVPQRWDAAWRDWLRP